MAKPTMAVVVKYEEEDKNRSTMDVAPTQVTGKGQGSVIPQPLSRASSGHPVYVSLRPLKWGCQVVETPPDTHTCHGQA